MVAIGKVLRAGVLAAGTFAASTAAAQTVTLAAFLNNAQEVPTNTSPATGFGTLTYDRGAGTILVTLRASGLTGNTAFMNTAFGAAHVHLGAPGVNGGIAIPITTAAFGVREFNVTQSFTFAQLGAIPGINAANVTTLTNTLNGLVGAADGTQANLYFNVHTTTFPGGEIRGNLAVVPEPSTYALLGTGLAGLGFAARRRRSTKA